MIINLFMYNQYVFYFAKIQKNIDIITLMVEKQLKVDRTKGQSWKLKRVFAEGAIQIEKWKLKIEKGVAEEPIQIEKWKMKNTMQCTVNSEHLKREGWKLQVTSYMRMLLVIERVI